MTEFWESSFIEKQAMWGFEPAYSAIKEPPKNKEGKIHLPFLIATDQKR